MDSLANNSDIKFEPLETRDSIACTRASAPEYAVYSFDKDMVISGSNMAKLAHNPLILFLTPRFSSLITALFVTSEPVPDVVGIKINGKGGFINSFPA